MSLKVEEAGPGQLDAHIHKVHVKRGREEANVRRSLLVMVCQKDLNAELEQGHKAIC